MTMGGEWTVTQPSLADGGVASCQSSSSSTAPDAVGTGSASAPNATQRASAEAAMMAKALASLTAASAAATPSPSASGGGGGSGGGINKPAILSAILRTAVPGNDIFLQFPPNSYEGVTLLPTYTARHAPLV